MLTLPLMRQGKSYKGKFFSLCCSYHDNISQVIRSFFFPYVRNSLHSCIYLSLSTSVILKQKQLASLSFRLHWPSNFRIPVHSFTYVGVLWRTWYITILAILIQWDTNKWTGILEVSALTQNFTLVISNTEKKKKTKQYEHFRDVR